MKKIFNLFDSLKKAWSTSSFKKRTEEKISGRSMIEMLCVLCVVVLLSLAAVKGWDYFEVRSRTNEVLDDLVTANASASTKRFTEKHNFADWTTVVKPDESKSSYGIQAKLVRRGGNVFYVLRAVKNGVPLRMPKDLCDQLLSSSQFAVFDSNEIYKEKDTLVQISSCGELNNLVFAFSPTDKQALANISAGTGSGGAVGNTCTKDSDCDIFGVNYACVSGSCAPRGYCFTNKDCGECGVCNNSFCETSDSGHCCNGVYCSGSKGGSCSGDACCVQNMCVCNTDADCQQSYGAGFRCISKGANVKACENVRCSSNADCRDGFLCSTSGLCLENDDCTETTDFCSSFGPSYVCDTSSKQCKNTACTSNEYCTQTLGANYICLNGSCTNKGCRNSEDCARFGSTYLCTKDNICESTTVPACTADTQCSKFGTGFSCFEGVCRNINCANSSDCASFGSNWVCYNNLCRPNSCASDSECQTRFGSSYVCLNGGCTTEVCSSSVDCLKFGSGTVCSGSKCAACSIQNCTEHYVDGETCKCSRCGSGYAPNTEALACVSCHVDNCSTAAGSYTSNCLCKTCQTGYEKVNSGGLCCKAIQNCRSNGGYNSDCSCRNCANNTVPSKTGAKCCPIVENCNTYDDETCKCTKCDDNVSAQHYRYPSESGSVCCDQKNCYTYNDNCGCAKCYYGYQPEPYNPYGQCIECGVQQCTRYEDVINSCKCITCGDGYDVNPNAFASVDTRYNYQCCPHVDNCTEYDSHCTCIACSGGQVPGTIKDQYNNEMGSVCCSEVDGCATHIKLGSYSYCGCGQCSSGYTQAEYNLCCLNRDHCDGVYTRGTENYPNTSIQLPQCACRQCESGYSLTIQGNYKSCDTIDYCLAYKEDCTCHLCENDHPLRNGQCCETITDCNTYNSTSCKCATNGCASGKTWVNEGDLCCTAVPHCKSNGYTSYCSCKTDGCESGYTYVSGKCYPSCATNSDCASGNFCSFQNATSNSDKGPGACVPITTYGEATKTVGRINFLRSTEFYKANYGWTNWWTAENWCLAKGKRLASTANLGCGSFTSGTTGSCTTSGTALASLKSGGWSNWHWLSDSFSSDKSYAVQISSSQIGDVVRKSTTTYALCMSCVSVGDCAAYGDNCRCTSCNGVKIPVNTGTLCCKEIPSCNTYDANCNCTACSGTNVIPVNSNKKCCKEIANCNSYKDDCSCSSCASNDSTHSYRYPSTDGSVCCEQKNCTSYNNSCGCASCTTGQQPEPYNPTGSCIDCAVSQCTRYEDSSNLCKCITCDTGYDLNTSAYGSLDTRYSNQCCKHVDNCNTYESDCSCAVCTGDKIPGTQVDQYNEPLGSVCCSPITGCSTYIKSGSYSYCGCGQCSSGYTQAEYDLCCQNRENCASYDRTNCYCATCTSGVVTYQGNCKDCDANYCLKYNDDCTCHTCPSDHPLRNGYCCDGVTNCETYNSSNCTCDTCTSPYKRSSTGLKCCSSSDSNCKTFSDTNCSCTACNTGYTLKSGVCRANTGAACQTNDDCYNNTDYCAFNSPSTCSNKGSGVCTNIGSVVKITTISSNGSGVTEWIGRGNGSMKWWSAENWCARQGYTMATLSSVGCSVSNGQYCGTAGTSTASLASVNIPLGGLQRTFTQGGPWLNQITSNCNGYTIGYENSLFTAYNRKDYDHYPLCYKASSCSAKSNCAIYNNSTCACTTCKDTYSLVNNGSQCCQEIQYCDTANNGYNSSCKCTKCTGGRIAVNNNSRCCTKISNANSSCTTYDSNCKCTACSNNQVPGGNGSVCCPKITNCNTYDANCRCTACDANTSTDSSRFPNASGTACCEQKLCGSYNDSCGCATCWGSSEQPDPYNPSGACISCGVSHCYRYGDNENSQYCRCITCDDGYTLNESAYNSIDTRYNYQCCPTIAGCNSYDSNCNCATCTGSQVVGTIIDQYNNPLGETCCSPITGCSTYIKSGSYSYCGCGQCSSGYTQAEYNVCCQNKANCASYNRSDCSCQTCSPGYVKTYQGTCKQCDSNYCTLYNDDCTCHTCPSDHPLRNGYCCDGVSGCSTYSSNSCACTACTNGTTPVSSGTKCCAKIDGCSTSGYNSSCKCTTCTSGKTPVNNNSLCCTAITGCSTTGYNSSCKCTTCTGTKQPVNGGAKCCNLIDHCSTYNDSCGCSACANGYTLLNGVCYKSCSDDSDCASGEKCSEDEVCRTNSCQGDHAYCLSAFGYGYACSKNEKCEYTGCQDNYPDTTCAKFVEYHDGQNISYRCRTNGYCSSPSCNSDADCSNIANGYYGSTPWLCAIYDEDEPGYCVQAYCETDGDCTTLFGLSYECLSNRCVSTQVNVSCSSDAGCEAALGIRYKCSNSKCVLKAECLANVDCPDCKECVNGTCVTSTNGSCCNSEYGQVWCRSGCVSNPTSFYGLCDHLGSDICGMTYGPEYTYGSNYWGSICVRTYCDTDNDCSDVSGRQNLYCHGGVCKVRTCASHADCTDSTGNCGKCLSEDGYGPGFEWAGYCKRGGSWMPAQENSTCCLNVYCPNSSCAYGGGCACTSGDDALCKAIYGPTGYCNGGGGQCAHQ